MKRYRKESVHQGRQKAFDKKLALYLICKIGKYKNKKSPLQWNIILGGFHGEATGYIIMVHMHALLLEISSNEGISKYV